MESNIKQHLHTIDKTMDKEKYLIEKKKQILEKMVSNSHKDWSKNLNDALWTYHIAFETPNEMP